MNQILFTLGAMSLGGSAAAVLLAWAGGSTRGRYGARWRCLAWMVLCLRLAVPLPLFPYVQARAPIQVDIPAQPVPERINPNTSAPSGASQDLPVQPGDIQTDSPENLPDHRVSVNPMRKWEPDQAAMVIWLMGAAAVLLWNLSSHLRFLHWLRRWSSPVESGEAIAAFHLLGDQLGLDRRPRLLVCQGLRVPMLAGVFRPVILLPPDCMSGEELGFSLLHELTHYRRKDIWRKLLALWVNALHWFNPLMWYMVRMVERDTELACDEDVLRCLSQPDYSAYGQTILSAVARLQRVQRGGNCHE